jgi:hypothetical protein
MMGDDIVVWLRRRRLRRFRTCCKALGLPCR